MNKPLYLALAVLASALLAWLVETMVRKNAEPRLDGNSLAWLLLVEGSRSQQYRVLRDKAGQALNQASDADLRKLADYLKRSADWSVGIGVETFQEGGSLSGGLKAFGAGLVNPGKGLDAAGLLLERLFFDVQATAERLEPKYGQYARLMALARGKGQMGFWITFVGAVGLALMFQPSFKTAGSDGSVHASGPDASNSTGDNATTTHSAQGELVACPSCGARNRVKLLRIGQRLDCGRCKTTIARAG
ncbi:MAG: hypothetical protein ABMA26_04320 [Limisphaerales bacterium]